MCHTICYLLDPSGWNRISRCSERISCHRSFSSLCTGAYAIFVRTQLLVHIPPPIEFDPFVEAEKLDRGQGMPQYSKRMRRGSNFGVPDTAVVIGKPEHEPCASFSFIPDRTGQIVQGMLHMHLVSPYRMSLPSCIHVSIFDYNKRASMAPLAGRGQGTQHGRNAGRGAGHRPMLLKRPRSLIVMIRRRRLPTCLKSAALMKPSPNKFPKLFISSPFFMDWSLATAFEALFYSFSREDQDLLSPFKLNRLNYYRNIRVQPELLQWLINHFDSLNNLFRHNDYKICPLFEEFNIIFGRIPVVKEVDVVSRLDIDPASLILPVFIFSAYEIPSYDFDVDAVPLQPLVDRALSMDHTRPYWPSLVCLCILS
ncbi:hypothetical protein JCGZ_15259 [Jatropha curcas]|uniref:Uncharacterized protein n=1 Tax=Jatropha curcas TaxID=180498 RepID=A0A067KE68_JATCU|nr:hypothetical protein JCGZ_15259 [Jatropha curcas]